MLLGASLAKTASRGHAAGLYTTGVSAAGGRSLIPGSRWWSVVGS
jgi:hypothetical protein